MAADPKDFDDALAFVEGSSGDSGMKLNNNQKLVFYGLFKQVPQLRCAVLLMLPCSLAVVVLFAVCLGSTSRSCCARNNSVTCNLLPSLPSQIEKGPCTDAGGPSRLKVIERMKWKAWRDLGKYVQSSMPELRPGKCLVCARSDGCASNTRSLRVWCERERAYVNRVAAPITGLLSSPHTPRSISLNARRAE